MSAWSFAEDYDFEFKTNTFLKENSLKGIKNFI